MKLDYIEGIGEVFRSKLESVGIQDTDALFAQGKTKQGRAAIAEKAEIPEKQILKWVNHAELMRVKGVGSEYADLLEAAGVDTVVELAARNPENLIAKLQETNEEKKLVRRMPEAKALAEWIEQAKELPREIEY